MNLDYFLLKSTIDFIKGDIFRIVSFFLGNSFLGIKARFYLLRLFGVTFRGPCKIYSGIYINSVNSNLLFGEGVFINANSFFDLNCNIYIGSNVLIGPNVSFITTSHKRISNNIQSEIKLGPINIGDNTFIGSGVTILGGCSIGKNSVIGACSFVNKHIPDNTLAFGVPVNLIRKI
jgi:acetyltransferase-like isoleucine patch superfamily enzyme